MNEKDNGDDHIWALMMLVIGAPARTRAGPSSGHEFGS